jgi:hypothetical protein
VGRSPDAVSQYSMVYHPSMSIIQRFEFLAYVSHSGLVSHYCVVDVNEFRASWIVESIFNPGRSVVETYNPT